MFTHRLDHDRERNLELVCDTLNKDWGLGLSVNKHHDIVVGGHLKVWGCGDVYVGVWGYICGGTTYVVTSGVQMTTSHTNVTTCYLILCSGHFLHAK